MAIEQVPPKADADYAGRQARDEDRPKRTASRWWQSRAQDGPTPEGPESTDAETSRAAEGRRRELADVGHELKSPLSIVLALCSRLEASDRLAPEDAEDVARIRAN